MENEKIKNIPKSSGVYIFKDNEEKIIYIGKAKNLRKRISTYFIRQKNDWKIQELIKEHTFIEHIITKTETEAFLLEAQLIKKFQPKYNVLLKSGNPFVYIVITNEEIPKLKLETKRKKKAIHFGPFLYKRKVRTVYEYLLRTFRLSTCSKKIDQGCLNYHIGKCAGSCLKTFDINEYKMRLEITKQLLNGNYESCRDMIKNQISQLNKNLEFEKSKHLKEYLENLETIFQTLKSGFSETKYTKDVALITTSIKYKIENPIKALEDLQILLNLDKKPKSIDCFDISNFQSSYIVGSCIRFTHGIPDKQNFRRFKIKTISNQNDYAALQEIVKRRYKNPLDFPDIILIDGGKGQLNSIKNNVPIPCLGLAKREELLYLPNQDKPIKLDLHSKIGQILIALRDYAHHFAISYHKKIRNKNLIS